MTVPARAAPETPERIAGYRIEGLLGTGGTSSVHLATQLSVERKVALKVFPVGSGKDAVHSIARLTREAKLLARLDHENVVRCFDFGDADGWFFIALELVSGESLKQRLDRRRLPSEDAVSIARQVLQGLAHAHEHNIVHRDVKPGNILLGEDGRVKLTDFGLARGEVDMELTRAGTTVGTPQYLSPEQARNPRQADARSDLYSLGATLYHMVTGSPPHLGDTLAEVLTHILLSKPTPPEELNAAVSPSLSRVIARLMAKDLRRRYANSAEAMADLRMLAPGDADEVVGLSWDDAFATPVPRSSFPRGKVLGAAAAGIVLVLVAVGARKLWPTDPIDDVPPTHASTALDLTGLETGALGPIAAWSRVKAALKDGLSVDRERRRVLDRVEVIAVGLAEDARDRGLDAMRDGRSVASGNVFEERYKAQVVREFGVTVGDLDPELVDIVSPRISSAKAEVERAAGDLRTSIDDRVDAALMSSQVRVNAFLDRNPPELLAASAAIDAEMNASEERVKTAISAAVKGVLGRPALSIDVGLLAEEKASYERDVERLRALVDRKGSRLVSAALNAVSAFAPSEAALGVDLKSELEDALKRVVESEVGVPLASIPDADGALRTAMTGRVKRLASTLAGTRSERQRVWERTQLEELDIALSMWDLDRASNVTKDLPQSIADPWLNALRVAVDDLMIARGAVLEAFRLDIGEELKLISRADGITRPATLKSVDSSASVLYLVDPELTFLLRDLDRAEWVRRAGTALTARAQVVLLMYDGELQEAVSSASTAERNGEVEKSFSVPFFAEVKRRRDAVVLEQSRRVEDMVSLLDEFDDALLRGDDPAVEEAALELLSSKFHDIRELRSDRPRLKSALDSVRDRRKVAEARSSLLESTVGAVVFNEAGVATVTHVFDGPDEATDFRLPGREWRIKGGVLTSLVLPIPDEFKDDFGARSGLIRALPYDPKGRVEVAMDLEIPYEVKEPGKLGIRLLSSCFVIRPLPSNGGRGQLNAWAGDLSSYHDHFFDPHLGEVRPRSRSAGPIKEFGLERGRKYRVKLEWTPSRSGGARAGGQCELVIDGDVVYTFVTDESPERLDLEIRSVTPVSIREITTLGSVPGAAKEG